MEVGYINNDNLEAFETLLLPDAVKAIRRGEAVTALGLVDEDVAAGALAGYIRDSTYHVLSFYVAPGHRRKGGGFLLFGTLLSFAKKFFSAVQMDFTVTEKEHAELCIYLEMLGFVDAQTDEGGIYETTCKEAWSSPVLQKVSAECGMALGELTKAQMGKLVRILEESGAPAGREMLLDAQVDQTVSRVHVKEGEPDALILFRRQNPDGLELSLLWNGSKNAALPIKLIGSAIAEAKKSYTEDTTLRMQTTNSAAERLLYKLLPDAMMISASYRYDVRTVEMNA